MCSLLELTGISEALLPAPTGERRRDTATRVAVVNLSVNQQYDMEEWLSIPVAERFFQATRNFFNDVIKC